MKILPERFVNFCKRLVELPTGPCMFCGSLTTECNEFDRRIFRHQHCTDEWDRKTKQDRIDRKAIDLIKIAIKELEQEKQIAANDTPSHSKV